MKKIIINIGRRVSTHILSDAVTAVVADTLSDAGVGYIVRPSDGGVDDVERMSIGGNVIDGNGLIGVRKIHLFRDNRVLLSVRVMERHDTAALTAALAELADKLNADVLDRITYIDARGSLSYSDIYHLKTLAAKSRRGRYSAYVYNWPIRYLTAMNANINTMYNHGRNNAVAVGGRFSYEILHRQDNYYVQDPTNGDPIYVDEPLIARVEYVGDDFDCAADFNACIDRYVRYIQSGYPAAAVHVPFVVVDGEEYTDADAIKDILDDVAPCRHYRPYNFNDLF